MKISEIILTISITTLLTLYCIGVGAMIEDKRTLSIEELLEYCPNIEEKLEEFMGGDITFTEEGQAWINSVCEASK